jgi:DNA (cytosine-5)-methyltransferase 3A
MKVSEANYPDIIQVGDVTELDTSTLPNIDLVMGGSPCQGFSFAGKQLAFDDPRSALFFEFVRCVEELKPKYFLLENVRMKKEYLDVISEYMGVEPIMINSALVSAQNRVRYYWTNIPNIEQPEQRGIVLRDILEDSDSWSAKPQYLKNHLDGKPRGDRVKSIDEKSSCLTATMHKGQIHSWIKKQNNYTDATLDKMTTKDGKSYCLTASYQAAEPKNSIERKQRTMVPVTKNKKLPKNISLIYDNNGKSHKPIQIGEAVDINGHDILKRVYSEDGKSPTLNACTGGNREPKVMVDKRKPNQINPSKKASGKQPYMQDRVFHVDGKSHALTREFASRTNVGDEQEVYWRKLTPIECERLQTVPDNYTNHVSNTQRYKMLGNGWTIEVICHILNNMQISKGK